VHLAQRWEAHTVTAPELRVQGTQQEREGPSGGDLCAGDVWEVEDEGEALEEGVFPAELADGGRKVVRDGDAWILHDDM
jgi:hypothetical protein